MKTGTAALQYVCRWILQLCISGSVICRMKLMICYHWS